MNHSPPRPLISAAANEERIGHMDLLQLKYFCEIAREEHITRAARNLNIAQPALSASLNRLEKELGISLFDRVGRNICLNSCGQAFYQYISPALLLIENGERAMEDFRAPETNTLMLGSINQSLLQEAILAYRKKYPDIRISQLTIDPQDAEQEMKRNYFDFLILPQRLSMPGVIQDTLVEERFMIAINREHPLASEKELSLEQLKDEPFICLPQGYSFRKFTDSICEKAGFKPHVVMECFHCQMLDLIAADAGIALVSESFQQKCLYSHMVKVIPIAGPPILRPLVVARSADRYLSKTAQNFLAFLKGYYTNNEIEPLCSHN